MHVYIHSQEGEEEGQLNNVPTSGRMNHSKCSIIEHTLLLCHGEKEGKQHNH